MDDDIDFLFDDEPATTAPPQPQPTTTASLHKGHGNGDDDDDDDDDPPAFAGATESGEDEEEEDDDQDLVAANGEWTEDSVRHLIAEVAVLKERFARVALTIRPHSFVWVPCSAVASREVDNPELGQPTFFVNGLAKLRHKLDTELKLLVKYLGSGEHRRAQCNNIKYLELVVHTLEVERDLLFVSVTLPFSSKKGDKGSIDVDIISRGGLRWIKLRGSSARNLEADVVVDFDDDEEEDAEANRASASPNANDGYGGAEDGDGDGAAAPRQPRQKRRMAPTSAPSPSPSAASSSATATTARPRTAFVEMLARMSAVSQETGDNAALHLPFGEKPELLMVCAGRPSEKTLRVLAREAPALRCVEHSRVGYERVLPPLDYDIQCVCWDVTAMVAIASDVCNGFASESSFPQNPVLERQAAAERGGQRCIDHYLAPLLRRFTKDQRTARIGPAAQALIGETADKIALRREHTAAFWKAVDDREASPELAPQLALDEPGALGPVDEPPGNWVAPEAGVLEFLWIVETISGPLERRRAMWLLRRIRVVDTAKHRLLDRFHNVFAGNPAIKPRQLNVFACGHATNALTLTANKSFLCSAFESGVMLCTVVHPARALTERKRLGIDIKPDKSMWMPSNKEKVAKKKSPSKSNTMQDDDDGGNDSSGAAPAASS